MMLEANWQAILLEGYTVRKKNYTVSSKLIEKILKFILRVQRRAFAPNYLHGSEFDHWL